MAVVASVSGLNVAQPDLAATFGASQSEVLWIINAYTVTLAALLLPLGAVGDRWGRRPVLVTGLLVFGVANVAAAIAPSTEAMVAARLVSGVGAAMIMPVTLSVITASFPAAERSRAIGTWTAVAGGGGILGMYLSALLVDVATWRWLFVLPVVLTVVALVLGLRTVPGSRVPATGRPDVVGALTSVVATLGLTSALHEAPSLGWDAPFVLVALGAATVAGAVFVAWELRVGSPLLDVRHFRARGLSVGTSSLLVLFGVVGGVSLVLYPFLQVVLGWGGLRSTLGLMPLAVLMMVTSGLAPRVAARLGARLTIAAGLGAAAAGLALMALLVSPDRGYVAILPGLAVTGLGAGLAMTPSTEAITSSLPREQQGVASALNDLTRELGSALGIALLGGVVVAGYRSAVEGRLAGVPDDLAAAAREGLANAAAASRDAGPDAAPVLVAAQEAFVQAWQQAMTVGVGVLVVLALLVLLRGPRREHAAPTSGEARPRQDSNLRPRD
ncbi:MAG: MFS transporter [Aeromicrobium erythreum]